MVHKIYREFWGPGAIGSNDKNETIEKFSNKEIGRGRGCISVGNVNPRF